MVKTNWVVSDEYQMFGIFSTRADAEEFILSLAEGKAYEDYISEIYHGMSNMTTEEYIDYVCNFKHLQKCWTMDENGKWHIGPRYTTRSAILEAAIEDAIFIDEVLCYTEN
jgi:hypothetical protein